MSAVIREIRHAPRCKFCKVPRVAEVNEVLAKLTAREVSKAEAAEQIAALGVENPLAGDGWKHHWSSKGHYYVVSPKEAEKEAEKEAKEAEVERALAEEALAVIARVLGEDWRERGVTPTPEQVLEIQRVLYVHELELRLAAGLPAGISHDHVLKSISEGTKRRQSESVAELNKALSAGVGAVFQKALGGDGTPALESGDIVIVDDAEVIEEDVS